MGAANWRISVISLPGAHDRRAQVTERLEKSVWPWQLVDARATAPAGLLVDQENALKTIGRRLAPGEIGCFGSHVDCWRQLLADESLSHMLVMEDDVLLDPNYDFASLVQLMAATGLDYVRLYARWPAPARIISLLGPRCLVRFKRPVLGTQAYVLSRQGARRLLAHATHLSRPIDDHIDRFWENGVPIYSLYPFPALELQLPSSVQARNVRPTEIRGWSIMVWRGRRVWDRARAAVADLRLIAADARLRGAIRQSEQSPGS